MRNLSLAGMLLFAMVCSCRLGPQYTPPEVSVPEQWKGETVECTPCVDYWWEVFEDETLSELIWCALENSPNLYAALEKVVEARALAGVSGADLYPQLTLNPAYSTTGELFKLFLPGTIPNGFNFPSVFRIHQMVYNLPLNLSYQLDLWGKLHSQYDAAFFTAEAQEEAFHTAQLTLTTDLASDYFLMRSLDAQIEVLEGTLASQRKGLELATDRYEKGLAIYSDVSNATYALYNSEATYQDLVRQRALQENAIAVLVGELASEFCLENNPLQYPPPPVPAGLPADILLQRPDLAELERRMAAENALIGAAYASYFPSIQLTGTLGWFSPDAHDFMSWISRFWSMGANAAETVFDGGRLNDNLLAACARFGQAEGNYQQGVVQALREVEDALNNLEMEAKQSISLETASEAATKTAQLSTSRYQNGLVNYLEVVQNEQTDLDARRTLAALLGVRYLSTVQLIKALGGSWLLPDCDSEAAD